MLCCCKLLAKCFPVVQFEGVAIALLGVLRGAVEVILDQLEGDALDAQLARA